MKECMVYAKDRKTILCSAFGCMFSIGIAGIIILPYFMGQWSYDRRIGPLHMILGGVCFCVGIILLYLLFKKYISRETEFCKSVMIRCGMLYLIGQLVVSCIMGGIGWGIAKTGRPGTDKMADLSVIRILSEHDTCRVYLLIDGTIL